MAIHYKIKPISNNRFPDEKPIYKVTLLTTGNIGTEELAKELSHTSSFTPGDLYGIIRNLVSVISRELASGQTVTLDELGTFSISAELDKAPEDPEKITGKDIHFKRVCFKAAPMLKQNIKEQITFHKLAPDIKRWR
ncbi:MAG: HU family DNA-binding protein [Tannerellaceae bacterium]|nr:HU family DNA-binding protein [Tannerellaceae bacterium]